MKKILLPLFILILLVGCSQQNNDKANNSVFVRVEKTDEHNLAELVEGTHFNDFYQSSINNEGALLPLDNERMFNNELIVIDSESQDAKAINNQLNERYEGILKVRQEAETSLNDNADYFTWADQYLYDVSSFGDYVSFMVYNSYFAVPGSGTTNLEVYTFNTQDGTLLNNEAVLELHNLNLDDIKAYIMNDFESGPVDHYGQSMMRHLVDDGPDFDSLDENNVYYRLKPEFGMGVNDKDVVIILEMFLGLSGAFDAPSIYRIPLNDL
ncbi:MAG TPA: hypothetical protein VKY25_03395 [Erysipelothrix sp.]|nr:hypothetical protein [Erysipelothrix sp.]